jgi:hypothetical protein
VFEIWFESFEEYAIGDISHPSVCCELVFVIKFMEDDEVSPRAFVIVLIYVESYGC